MRWNGTNYEEDSLLEVVLSVKDVITLHFKYILNLECY